MEKQIRVRDPKHPNATERVVRLERFAQLIRNQTRRLYPDWTVDLIRKQIELVAGGQEPTHPSLGVLVREYVLPWPACPTCRKRWHILPDWENWRCTNCQVVFDDQPDEGGDYATNPARRLERQEEHQERKALQEAVTKARRALR